MYERIEPQGKGAGLVMGFLSLQIWAGIGHLDMSLTSSPVWKNVSHTEEG